MVIRSSKRANRFCTWMKMASMFAKTIKVSGSVMILKMALSSKRMKKLGNIKNLTSMDSKSIKINMGIFIGMSQRLGIVL